MRERVCLELDQDAAAVTLDCAYAQAQFFGDLAAEISFGDQFGNAALALREPRKPARDSFTRPGVAAALGFAADRGEYRVNQVLIVNRFFIAAARHDLETWSSPRAI